MRFAIIIVAFTSLTAHADTALELNIFGLSHHWDRAEARRLHTEHETNPGLGLRCELAAHNGALPRSPKAASTVIQVPTPVTTLLSAARDLS